jgi:hypothetical protein
MIKKQRLSASVDCTLIEAAESAVSLGLADNVSAWVNEAMGLKAERDKKLKALQSFLANYEKKHGDITGAEIAAATRRARTRAVVVRTASKPRRRRAA